MKTILTIFFLFLFVGYSFPADVKATWADNSDNEEGFRLESCLGVCDHSGVWLIVAKTGANVTFLFPVNVTVTPISFRLFAFNIYGDSLPSNIIVSKVPVGTTLSFTTGP